jgi:glutaminyl-tRNA synthetase
MPIKKAKNNATPSNEASLVEDPDAMFKIGFLADVYKERPVSEQVPQILTRFPPEPNVSNIS